MIFIVRYDASWRARWDEFVLASANATFLHRRSYMDYHADRFADCSLLAFDEKRRLVAVLPANIDADGTLWSHRGLTYGGWLTSRRHCPTPVMLRVWDAAVEWMRANGIAKLVYKPVPRIYCRYPSDDDLYALFRLGAAQSSCMVSSAIPVARAWLANEGNRRTVRTCNLEVGRSDALDPFMLMLAGRLESRYGAAPVHTPGEMRMLMERFPRNIRLFTACSGSEILAGTIVYFTDTVAHTQYIATTPQGRSLGAFPSLVGYLLEHECAGLDYLDFGTSCLDGGRTLNESLLLQKYNLGGRPVVYTAYTLTL